MLYDASRTSLFALVRGRADLVSYDLASGTAARVFASLADAKWVAQDDAYFYWVKDMGGDPRQNGIARAPKP
jgi:hypothetical protein